MNIFRFIAILPSSIIIWFGFLILGTFTLEKVVSMYCIESSGMVCFDQGWGRIESILITVYSALSAFFIVLASAVLAPYKKVFTATCVYIAGLITAFAIALSINSEWGAFIGAGVAGLLSLLLVNTLNKVIKKRL